MRPMTLGRVARFEVGQLLEFEADAGSQAILSSGGTDLFRCELGQSSGHYCLRIDDDIAAGGPSPHKAG